MNQSEIKATKGRDDFRRDIMLDTNEADKYRTSHGVPYQKPNGWVSWTSIPVLEQLKGKPWNNMALNMVHALRPSTIRVTKDCLTADSSVWRVTVALEEDNKTIKEITQEVEIACNGIRNGYDAYLYMKDKEIPDEQPTCFINPRGISRANKDTKIGI